MYIPRNQLDKAATLGYQAGFAKQTLKNACAKYQHRIVELTLD